MLVRATSGTRASVWPFVLFTAFAWGSGGLLSKGLVDGGIDPFTVTGVPFTVGAIVAIVAALRGGHLRRESLVGGLYLGALNSAFPALMFNLAYETLPAGVVTLILSTGPVYTAVAAHHVFADERFTRQKLAGLVSSLGGVAMLVASPGLVDGQSHVGVAVALAGALVAGLTGVHARKLAVRHGANALVAPQLAAAGLTPLLIGASLHRPLVPVGGFTVAQLAILVLIGAVASYAGFRSVMMANEFGTTGQVSLIGYLIPLIGVLGGVLFFDERLTGGLFAGAILILLGVTVTGRASRRVARTVRAAG